jgi:hypothetical protein
MYGAIRATRTPSKAKSASLVHEDCVTDDVLISSRVIAEPSQYRLIDTSDQHVLAFHGSNMAFPSQNTTTLLVESRNS